MPGARFVEPLSESAHTALVERYRTTGDADERSRCQMLLFSSQGKSVAAIAELTFFGEDTSRTEKPIQEVRSRYSALFTEACLAVDGLGRTT